MPDGIRHREKSVAMNLSLVIGIATVHIICADDEDGSQQRERRRTQVNDGLVDDEQIRQLMSGSQQGEKVLKCGRFAMGSE